MQEQKLETSDETIGIKLKVGVQTKDRYNKVYFDKDLFDIGDFVYVLSEHQLKEILTYKKDADNYIKRINQLEHEVNIANIEDLKNQIKEQTQTIAEKDAFIKNLEKEQYKHDATTKSLNNKIGELTTNLETTSNELATLKDIKISSDFKTKTINKLESDIKDLQTTISTKDAEISSLKSRIDEIGSENDNLTKQLEDAIDESEHTTLKNKVTTLSDEVATLTDELTTANKEMEYWKQSYQNLVGTSDEVVAKNESLIAENEKLRNDNNAINETNKLLNDNIIGLKTTFEQTLEDNTTKAKNTEKELKETIKNNQSHIDEITEKYQSLLTTKDNIPPKAHYDEVLALKDKIKAKEIEIDKLNGEIEIKLATQKSELEIAHADEINKIQLENTESKAQLLVAYNNNINNQKMQYNNLANEYNGLLDELDSITKWNALFDSRHKKIRKDKEPVPLIEIPSEQLPPSDETTLEYVPKE